MKQKLAIDFADIVYNGQWYTPLREALSAFVDKTQETVTGDVVLNSSVRYSKTFFDQKTLFTVIMSKKSA